MGIRVYLQRNPENNYHNAQKKVANILGSEKGSFCLCVWCMCVLVVLIHLSVL